MRGIGERGGKGTALLYTTPQSSNTQYNIVVWRYLRSLDEVPTDPKLEGFPSNYPVEEANRQFALS